MMSSSLKEVNDLLHLDFIQVEQIFLDTTTDQIVIFTDTLLKVG